MKEKLITLQRIITEHPMYWKNMEDSSLNHALNIIYPYIENDRLIIEGSRMRLKHIQSAIEKLDNIQFIGIKKVNGVIKQLKMSNCRMALGTTDDSFKKRTIEISVGKIDECDVSLEYTSYLTGKCTYCGNDDGYMYSIGKPIVCKDCYCKIIYQLTYGMNENANSELISKFATKNHGVQNERTSEERQIDPIIDIDGDVESIEE